MVLAQLGGSISRALAQMSNATVIDEKVLNDCLNEISRALLQADVQFKMVRDMQANIKRIVNLEALAAGTNKRRIMQQVRGVPVRRLFCAIRAQSVKSFEGFLCNLGLICASR
jgi:signal recognition particle GTPase